MNAKKNTTRYLGHDLKKDSYHLGNLHGQKGYENLTAGLKTRLEQHMGRYKDDEALELLAESRD